MTEAAKENGNLQGQGQPRPLRGGARRPEPALCRADFQRSKVRVLNGHASVKSLMKYLGRRNTEHLQRTSPASGTVPKTWIQNRIK